MHKYWRNEPNNKSNIVRSQCSINNTHVELILQDAVMKSCCDDNVADILLSMSDRANILLLGREKVILEKYRKHCYLL